MNKTIKHSATVYVESILIISISTIKYEQLQFIKIKVCSTILLYCIQLYSMLNTTCIENDNIFWWKFQVPIFYGYSFFRLQQNKKNV